MTQVVECTTCLHIWDDDDPHAEVCSCIDDQGWREVVLIEGTLDADG